MKLDIPFGWYAIKYQPTNQIWCYSACLREILKINKREQMRSYLWKLHSKFCIFPETFTLSVTVIYSMTSLHGPSPTLNSDWLDKQEIESSQLPVTGNCLYFLKLHTVVNITSLCVIDFWFLKAATLSH